MYVISYKPLILLPFITYITYVLIHLNLELHFHRHVMAFVYTLSYLCLNYMYTYNKFVLFNIYFDVFVLQEMEKINFEI